MGGSSPFQIMRPFSDHTSVAVDQPVGRPFHKVEVLPKFRGQSHARVNLALPTSLHSDFVTCVTHEWLLLLETVLQIAFKC